jgi:hypothetical protein
MKKLMLFLLILISVASINTYAGGNQTGTLGSASGPRF